MQNAINEALKCEIDVPVGCVIKLGDRIVAAAHNMREVDCDITAHAEMLAIKAAQKVLNSSRLNECELYVTLEPCPMCAAASAWAQIGRIVYGASDPKRGYSRFSPSLLHPKTEVSSGIMADECGSVVSEFFMKKR